MTSILGSQGVVLATAMAVSGTVILLALRLQKTQFPSHRALRSCLSSDEKKAERKKKKRVHFAEDVVDPTGNSEIFRRNRVAGASPTAGVKDGGRKVREMPANRLALYNGMLRDRRVAYSY